MRPPRSPEWTDTREAPGQGGEEKFGDTAWDRDLCGPPHLLAGEIPPNQLHGEPRPNPAGPSALQPRVLPPALAAPQGPGVGRSPRPALGDQCTSHHTDTRWVPRRSTPAWSKAPHQPKALGPCPQGSGAMPLGIAANFPGNFRLVIPGSGVGPSLSGGARRPGRTPERCRSCETAPEPRVRPFPVRLHSTSAPNIQHRAAAAGATGPGDLPGPEDLFAPGAPPPPRGITSLTA